MTLGDSRTAIVTGGSRGLGRALAAALAAAGWHVIIDGRDSQALAEAAARTGAEAVPGDITDPGHRAELAERARRRGGLDLLVNNAGGLGPSPLPALAAVEVTAVADLFVVNVVAQLGLIQECLPMLRAASGMVVDITSDASVEAYPGWGTYGATKAALDHLSRVLAEEEPSVAVWAVDPGDMRTRMHQDAFPGEDISDRPEPEAVVPAILALLERRPPSGRLRAAEFAPGAAQPVEP